MSKYSRKSNYLKKNNLKKNNLSHKKKKKNLVKRLKEISNQERVKK